MSALQETNLSNPLEGLTVSETAYLTVMRNACKLMRRKGYRIIPHVFFDERQKATCPVAALLYCYPQFNPLPSLYAQNFMYAFDGRVHHSADPMNISKYSPEERYYISTGYAEGHVFRKETFG